jgi:two-component system response regulator YesN
MAEVPEARGCYKVIVVDDEALVCIGIRNCIKWEETEFRIAGQASNGEDALDLIKAVLPDIVLTDIRMPKMDGLALLRRISREYPQVKVIVLSCLNELEIVKQALLMGAVDYVLKLSLQPDDLYRILTETKEKIEKEREESCRLKSMKAALEENRHDAGARLFRNYLNDDIDLQELCRGLKNLNPERIFSEISVAFSCLNRRKDKGPHDRLFVNDQLISCLGQSLMETGIEFFYIFAAAGGIVIILGAKDASKVFEHLQRSLEKRGISVFFGLSMPHKNPEKIKEQLTQAREAWKYSFYDEKPRIYRSGEFPGLQEKKMSVSREFRQKLVAGLVLKHRQETRQMIGDWLEAVRHDPVQPGEVKLCAENLCYELVKYVETLYADGRQQFEFSGYYSDIEQLDTLDELNSYLVMLLEKINRMIQESPQGSCRQEIIQAKLYIHANISRSVPLDEIAAHVALSRSHFSMLFKQETGESYTGYANRVKMEYARQLLAGGGLYIYEAAEKVGIDNENYFSKLFKKIIGVKPSSVAPSLDTGDSGALSEYFTGKKDKFT